MSTLLRVLVLEDQPADAELMIREIRCAGFVPDWKRVETEESFLAELGHSPELILSDYSMPRFDGLRALALLQERGLDIPFILISGSLGEEVAVGSMRMGAADYLLKDRLARLGPAVQRALEDKRLREERRRSGEALRASEEKYRLLFEASRDAIITSIPPNARFTSGNPAAIAMFRARDEAEFTSKCASDLSPELQPDGRCSEEKAREMVEKAIREGSHYFEWNHRRLDGNIFPASVLLTRFEWGGQTCLQATVRDITEQKLTQAKFLRAQRIESIGSLASGIAHDLNNILTPILMCTPLLLMENRPEGRRELAQTIEVSAQRAVGIVKQLLGFARGQEGRKQPIQIRHLIREMARMARETFPRSIRIEEICPPNLWLVSAEATQLHQVLLNLCVNARDAMPHGGTLRIRLANVTLDEHFVAMNKAATPGPFVRLQVEDTGTGIPEELRARIFESFFTTKGEGHGTGLGLTTVLGIVKDHQGFISFTSAVGKGTTFEIHLPAVPAAEMSAADGKSDEPVPRGRGELILVVDDEPLLCDTTRRTLESTGYRALPARNGIEALAIFSQHPGEVQAVITDFMMPLMDGVTLCRTLRVLSPTTPLIVSSGGLFDKGGAAALDAFRELGLRHILHKPHNADVLLRTVATVLHERAERKTKTDP
jgi:two-component system, cell cycle sensor histidine kinase and response regulator CckA